MTHQDNHRETQPQDKPLSMPGFPLNSLTNAPARREEPSQPAARTEQQRQQATLTPEQQRQANLAAVGRRRTEALAAQRRLATQRAQDTQNTEFREQLARVQQLCSQNRRDDTCPPECVVRQWRQGVPLGELNGMAAFQRRLNGNR